LPGRATIVHNAQELSVDALRDLINNLGYEAHLDDTARFEKNSTVRDVTNGPHRVKLSVTGMTCASCTGAVSSVLKAHAGVTNVSVQLMSGIAMFETTHGTDAVTIRTEVEELGYDCEVLENEPRSVDGQEPGHVSARALRTSRFRVDGMFCRSVAADLASATGV
jgi:copper chaperone CopZ